jgi:hypothetical protein
MVAIVGDADSMEPFQRVRIGVTDSVGAHADQEVVSIREDVAGPADHPVVRRVVPGAAVPLAGRDQRQWRLMSASQLDGEFPAARIDTLLVALVTRIIIPSIGWPVCSRGMRDRMTERQHKRRHWTWNASAPRAMRRSS